MTIQRTTTLDTISEVIRLRALLKGQKLDYNEVALIFLILFSYLLIYFDNSCIQLISPAPEFFHQAVHLGVTLFEFDWFHQNSLFVLLL